MKINDILPSGTSIPPREYSPLTLAFIGDCVYELYIRAHIVGKTNESAGKLHKECVRFVKAKAQADAAKTMFETLSEEEFWVFKRGRNAKSPSVPKNADVMDYHLATGFEALLGYLYLTGREERIIELCSLAVATVQND